MKGITEEPLCKPKSRTFNTQSHRNRIFKENLKIEKICKKYDFLQALDRI